MKSNGIQKLLKELLFTRRVYRIHFCYTHTHTHTHETQFKGPNVVMVTIPFNSFRTFALKLILYRLRRNMSMRTYELTCVWYGRKFKWHLNTKSHSWWKMDECGCMSTKTRTYDFFCLKNTYYSDHLCCAISLMACLTTQNTEYVNVSPFRLLVFRSKILPPTRYFHSFE